MAPNTARNDINQRLQNALEKLRQDCLRVEIWATALTGFSQPVPGYDPSRDNLLPPKNDNANDKDGDKKAD